MKQGLVTLLSLVLIGWTLSDTDHAWSARRALADSFPPGAVVGLDGTPHLWIADQTGVLHWGGDTRALQGQLIDWNTRITVDLDTLKTLQLGDPWLSAGLLKDGTPIYLVKWETTDSVPRLLHIQCIHDVEVFGINTNNYGRFVLDRDQWEAKFGFPVSTLQKGELATTDPTCSGGPTLTPTPSTTVQHPVIPLASFAVPRLANALSANGLNQSSINAARPTTLAIASGSMIQAAPLAFTPGQSLGDLAKPDANVPIGVLVVNASVEAGDLTLAPDAYLVKVRAGQIVFVTGDNQELQSGLPTNGRQLKSALQVPRTTLTYRDVCFSWAQVQVCTQPQPIDVLSDADRNDLHNTVSAAQNALAQKGLITGGINSSAIISEAEGVTAVRQQRGNVVGAPAAGFPGVTHNGPAPGGTLAGIIVVRDVAVDLPGHPQVPVGQYAVQTMGNNSQARLIRADNGQAVVVPSNNIEVRGTSLNTGSQPILIAQGLNVVAEQPTVDESLAIIANLCFSGDNGDTPLCLLFEPR